MILYNNELIQLKLQCYHIECYIDEFNEDNQEETVKLEKRIVNLAKRIARITNHTHRLQL